jgi:uncharacterized protein YjbI with pentapeptide repeats
VIGLGRWLPVLALAPFLLIHEHAAPSPWARPAPPPTEARAELVEDLRAPIPITGASPEPPARLPPARACQAAKASGRSIDELPGQVDGALVRGAEGLRKLRRNWKDALVVVRGGDFSGADLRKLRLHNLCFVGTKFTGSDWRGTRAAGIGFLWSDLTGARMQGARMPNILIDAPDLAKVDATGADFSDGSLSGNAMGSWEGLRLDRADLRRFRFYCGRTQDDQCVANQSGPGISFRGADLREAWIETYWGKTDWRGARLGRTQVSLRQLLDLAPARIDRPLVVREAKSKMALSPAEYRWLRRHMSESESLPDSLKGSRPAWMQPGTATLLAAPAIGLDPAARASPIYRRMLPVLVEGSSSVLLVEVRRHGRIDVEGSATGGNAHACSLVGRNLRHDRATGWFVGTDQGDQGTGAPPPDHPMPIVAFSDDRVDVYEQGHPWEDKDWIGFLHFGLCGARASFARMIRLPLSPAQAKWFYRAWGQP